MKNVLKYLLLALIAVSQLFACGGSDDEKAPRIISTCNSRFRGR